MHAAADREARILAAWRNNARAWTAAVREERIASRTRVTNRAVVEAVLASAPRSVLDIGCGEGWLARTLAARGAAVTGIDAVPELVAAARTGGGGEFHVARYAELAAGRLGATFDAAVCNFSLLGDDSVRTLLSAVPALLNPGGVFVVQTLHPRSRAAAGTRGGWRDDAWDGLGPGFTGTAPWYARSLADWLALFSDHGLCIRDVSEPTYSATGEPASVLFRAEPAA